MDESRERELWQRVRHTRNKPILKMYCLSIPQKSLNHNSTLICATILAPAWAKQPAPAVNDRIGIGPKSQWL